MSTVLGMKYPGRGTIFLEKSVSYVKPVYIGDTITCEITAAEKERRAECSSTFPTAIRTVWKSSRETLWSWLPGDKIPADRAPA